MSVSAPNPAASPAPGSSSAAGAAGTGVAGQTAHAHGPLTGFEALLAAFFGAQGATGDGTGGTGGAGAGPFLLGKLAGKIAAGDKATGPDGKTKAGDDAKAAGADATSTAGVVPDAALTVLVPPSISALIVVPTPPTTDAASPQPGAGPALPGGSDKTAGQVVAATLAQLGAPATLIHAAAVAVRGAPQTVANLAAQIAKKLDGRSTRFDVQLDPAGLGKVDVRVEIGGDGKMSASMAFDNPQAAAELKSRAGELQRALEQSGFDLSGGLSFDVASDSGQGRQAQGQDTDTNTGAAFRGRAFQTALDTTADAAPGSQPMFRRSSVSGVDIRI